MKDAESMMMQRVIEGKVLVRGYKSAYAYRPCIASFVSRIVLCAAFQHACEGDYSLETTLQMGY